MDTWGGGLSHSHTLVQKSPSKIKPLGINVLYSSALRSSTARQSSISGEVASLAQENAVSSGTDLCSFHMEGITNKWLSAGRTLVVLPTH